jgi:hypothetical protein
LLRPEHPDARGAALLAGRQAIGHGDRQAALDLLAALACGELPADCLEPVVSQALVATARTEREVPGRAAIARYEQTRTAGDQCRTCCGPRYLSLVRARSLLGYRVRR